MPTRKEIDENLEKWYEENRDFEKEKILERYTVSDNRTVASLIDKYKMTPIEARRLAMNIDGMTFEEIAEIEGRKKGTIQDSIEQARGKLYDIPRGRGPYKEISTEKWITKDGGDDATIVTAHHYGLVYGQGYDENGNARPPIEDNSKIYMIESWDIRIPSRTWFETLKEAREYLIDLDYVKK